MQTMKASEFKAKCLRLGRKSLDEINRALAAGQLPDFPGDPADRMIVATALEYVAILVTADRKILDRDKVLQKIDAKLAVHNARPNPTPGF